MTMNNGNHSATILEIVIINPIHTIIDMLSITCYSRRLISDDNPEAVLIHWT